MQRPRGRQEFRDWGGGRQVEELLEAMLSGSVFPSSKEQGEDTEGSVSGLVILSF